MNPREIICVLLLAFQLLFFIRLAMGFFPIRSGSLAASVRDLAVAVTDPVILPVRRSVPPLQGAAAGFGLAELLVLLALFVVIRLLCGAV
jgi:uncharacterized protein YggT (Ycf19 family)